LKKNTRSGDIVITMGAGDIWKFGEEFLEQLKIKN
jgi:UDP-N-acetylmuramate-alanine ligase